MKISIGLRTMFALLVFLSVLFTSMRAASLCMPVAYLFRHAEDSNSITKPANHPFDPTLSYSGQAHSVLYIQMMDQFQATQPYCPVTTVYSLNPILPSGGNGTSNPYWTAVPLAQKAGFQNPITTISGTILDEYLREGNVATKFLDAINVQLTSGQSVAIFWTSQGMCTVATTLGKNLPSNFTCDDNQKPPRNSLFIFYNYNTTTKRFSSLESKFRQCFNWNKIKNEYSSSNYYCDYSFNLLDFELVPAFQNHLEKLAGRIL